MSGKEVHMRYSPNESENLDAIIMNSYDDFVRMERRNLLLSSFVVVVCFLAEIAPQKAGFLGFYLKILMKKLSILFCYS